MMCDNKPSSLERKKLIASQKNDYYFSKASINLSDTSSPYSKSVIHPTK